MKTFAARVLLLFIPITLSCTGADDLPQEYSGPCDEAAVISKELYEETSSENYRITAASITGDCLEVELYASGCDGGTWKVNLYDFNAIAESYPVQRYLKVSLESGEICNAMVTKKITFDLSPLRTDDEQIIFNLEGWEEGLLYRY